MTAASRASGHGEHPPRHLLPEDVAAGLRRTRLARGWGVREAARIVGTSPGYLCDLEHARRCPSKAMARQLVAVLRLDELAAERLMREARPGVGRSRGS